MNLRGGPSNNKNGCSKIQYQKQGDMTSPTNNTTVVLETTIDTIYTEATKTATPVIPTTTSTTTDTATTNDYINKWVRNLKHPTNSGTSFTAGAWPQFCCCSEATNYGGYITTIEQACLKLEPHNAEERRAEMRGALRHSQELKRNITKQEVKTLVELKKDQSRVILTADKGVAIVIMDKEEYIEKAKILWKDKGTYKALKNRSNL